MTVSICIFAYNEEKLLPSSVAAIPAAVGHDDYRIHIVENGSKDETARIARMLSAADDKITVHELSIADKANAWNEYVFRIAPQAQFHIFLDGDIKPSVGSINALCNALAENNTAYGAAAMPVAGRSQRKWATQLLTNHYISGNLYAISSAGIERFRETQTYLPFGAKGEDGLVSYIFLTDFQGGEDDTHLHRIVPVADATFEFDSLSLNFDDLSLYHRRLKRYSERHVQKQILYGILKKHGLSAMPKSTSDIFSLEALADQSPRLHPIDFIYDMVTINRLRKSAQSKL